MRAVLDACVLYPPILRAILLDTARAGAFAPLVSARILEEWARAAARRSPAAAAAARQEAALIRDRWPAAEIAADPDLEATLSLPDADDRHVLATAITGGADALVTLNVRDFPGRTLARHGMTLRTPDSLLVELAGDGWPVATFAEAARAGAEAADGVPRGLRAMLRRAHLPRLGKALAAG